MSFGFKNGNLALLNGPALAESPALPKKAAAVLAALEASPVMGSAQEAATAAKAAPGGVQPDSLGFYECCCCDCRRVCSRRGVELPKAYGVLEDWEISAQEQHYCKDFLTRTGQ
jgi:hypothetical protein